MAICFTVMPICGHVWLLYAANFIYGLGSGVWDSSISLWLVEMWTTKSSAFLQGSQFTFGAGMIIGPLLAAPFVHGEEQNETLPDGTHVYVHASGEEREHALLVPFVVAGIIQGIVPVVLLVTYFIRPYRKPEESPGGGAMEEGHEKQSQAKQRRRSSSIAATSTRRISLVEIRKQPKTSLEPQQSPAAAAAAEAKIPYRILKIALIGISTGAYGSVENNFWNFYSSALQYLPVKRSATEAALILSVVCIVYTLGRLAAVFISLHVSPDIMLAYHFATTIVSLVMLYFACNHSIVWLLYLSSGLIGFGFSAIWPGLFSWTERYLKLTDGVCSLFSFLSGILTLVTPILIGDHLKKEPIMLFYLSAISITIALIAFIATKVFVHLTPA